MVFNNNITYCDSANAADINTNELRGRSGDKSLHLKYHTMPRLDLRSKGVVAACLSLLLFVYSAMYLNFQPSHGFQQGMSYNLIIWIHQHVPHVHGELVLVQQLLLLPLYQTTSRWAVPPSQFPGWAGRGGGGPTWFSGKPPTGKTLILIELYESCDTSCDLKTIQPLAASPAIHSVDGVGDDTGLHFKDITQFMRATTAEISVAPKVSLLTQVRNPCFAVTSQHWNAVNISLETAVKHHMTIKCLPYVYLLGKYFFIL